MSLIDSNSIVIQACYLFIIYVVAITILFMLTLLFGVAVEWTFASVGALLVASGEVCRKHYKSTHCTFTKQEILKLLYYSLATAALLPLIIVIKNYDLYNPSTLVAILIGGVLGQIIATGLFLVMSNRSLAKLY